MVSYQVFNSNTTQTQIMVFVSTLDIVLIEDVDMYNIHVFFNEPEKIIHKSKCKLRSYKL